MFEKSNSSGFALTQEENFSLRFHIKLNRKSLGYYEKQY